jgi:hypothetical protein
MRCPKCNQQFYDPARPCPLCQFSGDSALIEELSCLSWLLSEAEIWQIRDRQSLDWLRQNYTNRKKKLEIDLGLRPAPFTRAEARQAWPTLIQHQTLLRKMAEWLESGWLDPVTSQEIVSATRRQADELLERMEGHLRFAPAQTDADRLHLANFLLETAAQLVQNKGFVTPGAAEQARLSLLAEKEQLEIKLGLRPEPVPEPIPVFPQVEAEPVLTIPLEVEGQPAAAVEAIPELPAAVDLPSIPDLAPTPPAPRVPFRERLWQTLLSERTLQAMLFLGIFLLFSAALSFVVWGWKDFSAPLRVAIPTGFTGIFFTLGWYVRTKTPMYRSGIALSAIAAMLVPIDFYTVYVNFHIPADYWPFFWFIASTVCLLVYIVATFIIRSRLFAYLVGIAAGSVVLALIEMGHQVFGLSLDWRSAGLAILCLGLTILATTLTFRSEHQTSLSTKRIFANPLRYLALVSIGLIMLLTFGWRFVWRELYDTLHYALTLDWWLGSLIFAWHAAFSRSRKMGVLVALSLPVSIYLTQAAIFAQISLNPAWHAFGWAWLVALYLVVGYHLSKRKGHSILHDHGRTATRYGVVLLLIAAFWPLMGLGDAPAAAASTHAVLTGAVILAALLWRQPVYLYGASMLSFSATTFAMAELSLTLPQLTLAQLSVSWVSLAIAHIVLAINLGTRFPIPLPNLAGPLAIAGYVIAALAVLPPLFPYHGGLLTYALGNWLALAGWGARLAHIKQPGFIGRGVWRKPLFHWLTVLSLPLWVWALLNNFALLEAGRPLALAILAWFMLALSYRLAKVNPAYRWPWYLTGLLVSIVAPVAAFATVPDGFIPALTLISAGLLYFADAASKRQSYELAPAGLATAWGYLLWLERLHLSSGVISFGFALLIAIYFLAGLWVERQKSVIFTRRFLAPLYLTGHLLSFFLLAGIYLQALGSILLYTEWTDLTRLWQAAAQFLLAGVYGLYSWQTYKERWAHLVTWLVAAGSSFVAISYSVAQGSSVAAEMALIVIAFILLERWLHQVHSAADSNITSRQSEFIRLTWHLFKRPLLITGWLISAGVVALSLLYNLWLLGGGRAEQVWAIVALTMLTGLFILSARLFRQVRFVWIAASLSFLPWTILTDLSWFTFSRYSNPAIYTLSWPLLAWTLFLTTRWLNRLKLQPYAFPLRLVMQVLLPLSIAWSFIFFTSDSFTQALGWLAIGLLYFADAVLNRYSLTLAPAGLFTALGYTFLLDRLNVSFDALGFALALLVAAYVLGGLWVERKKLPVFSHRFLLPLYWTAHLVTLSILWRVYVRPFDSFFFDLDWTDEMCLWGAAAQLILGVAYGFYAWGVFKERWVYFATGLIALGGVFIAIAFSTGSGSAAAKMALGAIVFILAERYLYRLRRSPKVSKRQRAYFRLIWQLFQRPLLVTGWVCSAWVIALALIRNLLWLGGETRQIWAAIALLLITGLYALSARLFRQARFLWLAAPLLFIPWTVLTHLGWFTPYRPTLPGYGLSWAILSCLLLLASLPLSRRKLGAYALPVKAVANILLPLALLWGIADVDTSRFTFALAIGFYGLAAGLNHQQLKKIGGDFSITWQTKFFYPGVGLIPIWCVYLMAWLLPAARIEHYGLLFTIFGPLGLVAGQWLYRLAPRLQAARGYAFPAYLTGYSSLAVGAVLVAHEPPLLALVLLFDTLLMAASAWLFKQPAWSYPATLLAPAALWLALQQTALPLNRYGWWLIGLASIYLGLAWALRRASLPAYSSAPLFVGFSLIALGLPPSSIDQTGALWGYGSAAVLYILTAFWLRQPLLLTPATGLALVPYSVSLQKSPLASEYYGLALLAGASLALAIGWQLDRQYGPCRDFPWAEPARWFTALTDRLLAWWALPLYVAGFSLAILAPLFSQGRPELMALNCLLMMPLFGWAIYRFRLRIWSLATAIAFHFTAIFYLDWLNWWQQPDAARAWLGFLPVTLIMGGVALFIQYYRKERSPLHNEGGTGRWSYLLYIIMSLDIIAGQLASLGGTSSATLVTLTHSVLVGILASLWLSRQMVYIGLGLAVISLTQWVWALDRPIESLPVALSLLALGYGLAGYGLALIRGNLGQDRMLRPWLAVWELPLQQSGIALSLGTLVLAAWLGLDMVNWSIRAIFGLPFRSLVEPTIVRMVIGVFGFLGLLYVAAAFTHRWVRLGYVAIAILLMAWMLHVFYIQQWDDLRRLQWYALPAGLYLSGIAYLEWQQNNKTFARWLDYAAMILMIGSLFWQTLLFGWGYALLLGSEGLSAFFWGSGRRLRRFLYGGMAGVILATLGQLLNSLRSINQWIVFGIIGLLLVLIAIIVERKLEDIKAWYEIIESWE